VQSSFVRDDRRKGRGEEHHTVLARALAVVAKPFKRRPDLSLVNVKFTDTFERELAGQGFRNRNW
jgi:hypothetical protein